MDEIVAQIGIQHPEEYHHGKTTLAILQGILNQDDLSANYAAISIGYRSLFGKSPILPEAKISNDIRPDVGVYRGNLQQPQYQNLLFVCEEDSYENKDFLQSVFKACHYARSLCRLSSMGNVKQDGVCLVFPSAHPSAAAISKSVVQVSCRWDYTLFFFLFTAKVIPLDQLVVHIKALIRDQISIAVGTFQKYLFKLDPDQVNGSSLFTGRYTFNFQYPARSMVLNVTPHGGHQPMVMKIVSASQYHFLQRLKCSMQAASVLHYMEMESVPGVGRNTVKVALLYEECISPLNPAEAKSCLRDFIGKLGNALSVLHDSNYEHCDMRLENICFRRNGGDDFELLLIDLEFQQDTRDALWKSTLGYLSSCMYTNIDYVHSVDCHQLGYMIVWICRYLTQLQYAQTKVFRFEGNADYHSMHLLDDSAYNGDTFVGRLINEGK